MAHLIERDGKTYCVESDGTEWEYAPAEPLKALDEYKQDKIDYLNKICNETILNTFISSAMGTEHIYVFDYEAQMNFAGAKQAFQDNIITSVDWNTRDAGVIAHNATQFNQLWLDGFTHKMTNINKFRNLKEQVNTVTTKDQVDQINW
jgi:hypothetical protein